jgi:hypothetical protein
MKLAGDAGSCDIWVWLLSELILLGSGLLLAQAKSRCEVCRNPGLHQLFMLEDIGC